MVTRSARFNLRMAACVLLILTLVLGLDQVLGRAMAHSSVCNVAVI